jgi:hypothetical protein
MKSLKQIKHLKKFFDEKKRFSSNKITCVLGGQWGDEGKGKLGNFFIKNFKLTCWEKILILSVFFF